MVPGEDLESDRPLSSPFEGLSMSFGSVDTVCRPSVVEVSWS
jgi:hypothetical protein